MKERSPAGKPGGAIFRLRLPLKLDVVSESVNADSSRPAAPVHPSSATVGSPLEARDRWVGHRPSVTARLALGVVAAALLTAGCSRAPEGEVAPEPRSSGDWALVADAAVIGESAPPGTTVSAGSLPDTPGIRVVGRSGGMAGVDDGSPTPVTFPVGTEPAFSEGSPAGGSGEAPDPAEGRVAVEEIGGHSEVATGESPPGRAPSGGAASSVAGATNTADGLEPDAPWSDRTLATMTLWEKVGQMLMPLIVGDFAPEGSERHDETVRMIEENRIGGVIVSVGSPTNVAVKLNDLQTHSDLPLLVASDLETGAGFRFDGVVHLPGVVELGGATQFPPLMALGAIGEPRYAYEVGRVTAREARALGIHVPFAPVLDVNNNPGNPVINVRAFGEDPDKVAEMGVSFVRGIQDHGALAAGKHFPGHGDTETDSHVDLPVIPVSRDRLELVELLPFRRAVAAGMGGIMTAHLSVPELTGSGTLPATLSHPVVTKLLREDLGFDGLVFTDAMNMQAVERGFPRGEAAVRAVEAGADVILMPPSLEEAQEAIVSAVWSGRIDEERIDASVLRILGTKEQMGLHRRPEVSLSALPRTVGIREHTELAREIAEQSITVLRNDRNLLPLLGTRSAEVFSVSYRARNDLLAGKHFDDRLRETYPRLRNIRIDRGTSDEDYERMARRTRGADLVVVSLYVNSVSRDGDPVLSDELIDYIELLEARRTPHLVVSFGNPYLITDISGVQAYMLAWGGSQVSQVAAARALFGDFPVRGRLPIDIPRFFAQGEGLRFGEVAERAGGR